MRNIKFRALVEYGEMKNQKLTYNKYWEYYTTFDQPVWMGGNIGKIIIQDLQYTGLNDKNGNEIYEGDVVKCFHYEIDIPKDYFSIFSVEYNDKQGTYCVGKAHNISLARHRDIEVIGNIYETEPLNKPSILDNTDDNMYPFDDKEYQSLKKEYWQLHDKADKEKQEIFWQIVIEDCEQFAFDTMNRKNRAEKLMDKFIISKK